MAISGELTAGFLPPEGAAGDVQVFFDEHETLIRLSGEIDLALGPELEDAGRDAIDRGEPVRIDVTHVTFIDSIGLGFLARLASAGHNDGCPPRLIGASPRISETVALAGLDNLLA